MNAKTIKILGLGLDPRTLPKCVTGQLLTFPSLTFIMSPIDEKILTP